MRAVYLGSDGLIAGTRPDALLIDCSTIDVETSRAVHAAAAEKGLGMVDAPVSGGVPGAEAGPSPSWSAVRRPTSNARPVLSTWASHLPCRPGRHGPDRQDLQQHAARHPHDLVAEAFGLARPTGSTPKRLFEIVRGLGGNLVAGQVLPVARGWRRAGIQRAMRARFTADLMLKDLGLAQEAAAQVARPRLWAPKLHNYTACSLAPATRRWTSPQSSR